MAEVIGTVAAVLQLTQAAATTALQVYEFFSVIHNAPQEISTLSRDVRAFYTLFHNLETSLGSAGVKAAIDRDVEIETALKTLIDPISNCRAALSRMKDKLSPHLRADISSVQVSKQDSEAGRPISVERLRMRSGNVSWFFKRKEVFASALELERTKATFGDAMGSITLLLALKQSTIKSESRVIAQNHDFNDDAGSALSNYATSIVDVQQDESSVKKPLGRSIARTEKPKTDTQTRIKLARELKIGIDGNSKFVVKAVLQHVDVDVRGRKGRTALSHAAEAGNVEITKLLLEEGASISARQYSVSGWAGGHNPHHCSGITPLHWAARKGHKQVVELLLQYGANPNARGTAGRAPIQEASCGNHIEVVKLLLSKKADVNAQSYYDGWTSLHEAVFAKRIQLVQLLIASGALLNVHLIYPDEKAPLHFAVALQSLRITKMLLEAEADPNVLMVEDITPLHLAAAAGWIPGIELLVSFGADLDARDTFTHETPLHKSARNRQVRAIEKLCGLGANREAKNCDGQSYADILECATEDPKEWAVHNSRASYFRQQNDSARP
ncbi:hypothetical protein N7530_003670 [Penicillium desertorum]|uniref:Fungal N-terminal domain-containing protein n=1 Tax=Penicillium desertorum TaxID=1303715 RepID=A0A9X0BQ48_9EURO|nr:hypothetical protein N7530_003670 [Penicillium desertorum]